ncbi:MAG: phosphoenolpyruvate--protein phosphotransferase [Alphaproteobacteria bacterium]|nr:phosphoenolpyruvate--protein phosphotransferase [Alphaproteobacteria bacterium]MBT4086028.1 phosphoenolpyruvate--protein phosphotransferase [Alphaproteobacteria bacterium]MBT4542196.1 phosphoenolpyruvate--protein phosphotransferase [Alphaproteobacteria bacterium]MBT5917139.1 phosphoenolpyruvate--protein phosphotransferase [Alphaproteobacteria bacterium]MBT7746218.1 phosphoenolpyruvate--protein phosphotransferase [Alphaproteobacteria bacterium]
MSDGAVSGSRVLLRRLREIMAGPGTAQQRLDLVVRGIAGNMVAEVCSVYLRRAGETLELFATEGLNPDAVHQTRLLVGEGLVGDIAAHARPLNLSDAQAHPNFAYRAETGEDIYQSLLGAPVMRSGRVIGVLIVQNRTSRQYSEEEVEALQTVAMVLAELVGGGELIPAEELVETTGNVTLQDRLEGVMLAEGLAQGVAVLHEPRVEVKRLFAENPDVEQARFQAAMEALREAVDAMLESDAMAGAGEHRDIIETYRMFADDRGWIGRIEEAVASGLSAEAAVQRVQVDTRRRMMGVADPYIRERLHDLDDLANRLLRLLSGKPATAAADDLPQDAVLIARNMGPAELLDYDQSRLRAVVLEEGSATAHVTIVAKALRIPMLGRVERILERAEPGDPVIVDADTGFVFIRPGEDVEETFATSMAARNSMQAEFAALRSEPAITRDGVEISLNVNANLIFDMAHLGDAGADGVGLFRTEIPFLVQGDVPPVEQQAKLYSEVLARAHGRPVTFRTLDIGGDKAMPAFAQAASAEGNDIGAEENPAMGWRSLRIGLDRPALLRNQLRALLQATAGGDLKVMFPMVSEVAEFKAARKILDIEVARMTERGSQVPGRIDVGAMIEVPILAWQIDPLLKVADFVSIGSNDLLQFLFASDRGNPTMAGRYDPLSPAVLAIVGHIASRGRAAGVPVSLCGEMAGRPLEAMALVGMGLKSLSMPAASVGPVKRMLRSLDLGHFHNYLQNYLDSSSHSLRDKLRNFAQDHDIAI